jgi:uncharacterized membrane protein
MDLYLLFKFLHVAAAILWIGSGVGLVILGIAADRRKDTADYGRIIKYVTFLAPRLFIPSSLAVLICGLVAAWLSWSFADLWIDIGLVGFAATFVTGNFLLSPRASKVAKIEAEAGMTPEAISIGHQLLTIAKFDYVMLFVVVADMVFKPTANDWLVLLIMALAVVAAGIAFIVPVLRGEAARA